MRMMPCPSQRCALIRPRGSCSSATADVIDTFDDAMDLAGDVRRKIGAFFPYFFQCERQFPVELARRRASHLVNQGVQPIGLPDEPAAFEFVPDCVNDGRELIAAR
jgi:hypothetical protein